MSPPTSDRGDLTPTERRLRAALSDRANHIQPSTDGLDRIEEKLMEERTGTDNRKWIYGGLSAAAAVVLLIVGVVALGGDDDEDTDVVADTTTTTTSTTEPTTTTTTESTTTTTAPFTSDVDPYGVAYPSPLTSQRFQSPEAAGRAYATEVLGFTDLVLSDFLAGDSRSGELPISDREDGPQTLVLLRQMEDDSWYVLASVTENITVDAPTSGQRVTSPFETTGSALAFEGTVSVLVRAQDDPTALGEGTVTGSGTPPAGPFDGSIEFTPPAEDTPGIVVYRTSSAQDGHVQQATSFPVQLAGS